MKRDRLWTTWAIRERRFLIRHALNIIKRILNTPQVHIEDHWIAHEAISSIPPHTKTLMLYSNIVITWGSVQWRNHTMWYHQVIQTNQRASKHTVISKIASKQTQRIIVTVFVKFTQLAKKRSEWPSSLHFRTRMEIKISLRLWTRSSSSLRSRIRTSKWTNRSIWDSFPRCSHSRIHIIMKARRKMILLLNKRNRQVHQRPSLNQKKCLAS